MEITGKIIDILPAQTGQSQKGEWKKQWFILETIDQFPKKICFENWNDKVDLTFDRSKNIKVFFDIDSREFNQKWYTNLRAWKIEIIGSPAQPDDFPLPDADFDNEQPPIDNDIDDLPF